MKNKLVEHSLIAFAIFLCTFFSWIFISQADVFGDVGLGEGGIGSEGEGGKSSIIYFASTISTSADEAGNYWLDEALSEPAGEIPDFYTSELHITRGAEFEGDAVFINEGSNQGDINGNATFIGDLSENTGTISGTHTRLYNADAIAISRDFTIEEAAWTVVADGVPVNVTNAIYNETTTFTRLNGGFFVSDMSVTEATLEGRTLTLTYDRALNSESIPNNEDYTVTVGGEVFPVSEVAVTGSSVVLQLGNPVESEVEVTISYSLGENQVLSEQGLNGGFFDNMAVTLILPEENEEEEEDNVPPQEEQEEEAVEPIQNNVGGSLPLSMLVTPRGGSEKKQVSEKTTTLDKSSDHVTVDISQEKTENEKIDSITSVPTSKQEILNSTTPSTPTSAVNEKLEGKVLLSVEDKGRIWYVAPVQQTRYEISTSNALHLFQNVSLGITNKDLEKIPVAGVSAPIPPIAKRLTGRFLLQVENRGQTWYVDQSGYRHKVTTQNVVEVTKSSALGIANKDLNLIAPGN